MTTLSNLNVIFFADILIVMNCKFPYFVLSRSLQNVFSLSSFALVDSLLESSALYHC